MRTALLLSIGLVIRRAPRFRRSGFGQPASHLTPRRAAPRPTVAIPTRSSSTRVTALKQAVQRESQKNESKSKIVCGMTIIEADPYFDQKMKVTPPKDGERALHDSRHRSRGLQFPEQSSVLSEVRRAERQQERPLRQVRPCPSGSARS